MNVDINMYAVEVACKECQRPVFSHFIKRAKECSTDFEVFCKEDVKSPILFPHYLTIMRQVCTEIETLYDIQRGLRLAEIWSKAKV